jgi:hypothetical protein
MWSWRGDIHWPKALVPAGGAVLPSHQVSLFLKWRYWRRLAICYISHLDPQMTQLNGWR